MILFQGTRLTRVGNTKIWFLSVHYVFRSLKDGKFYIGCSNNLKKRFDEHNKGCVESTKNRVPFELIYYEACLSKYDAYKREKYLKTNYGRRYLNNGLKHFLENLTIGQIK